MRMPATGKYILMKILGLALCCVAITRSNRLLNQSDEDEAKIFYSSNVPTLKLSDLYSRHNFSFHRYRFDGNSCTNDRDCKDPKEICNRQNFCVCRDHYERDIDRNCVLCPGLGAACDECCGHSVLYCLENICTCTDGTCQGSVGVFVTASQIALSAALIMGFAALAMLIYRLCTKPRYLTARQRSAERSTENVAWNQTSFLRASLSSIQIRVLSRLRDRPPAYDTQARTRQEVVPVETVQVPEAPPPYEERTTTCTHQPPAYSELILAPGEFINRAYVDTESNTRVDVPIDDSEAKTVIESRPK